MGGWSCPHETDGKCLLVNRLLKKQAVKQSTDGLPKLRRQKAKQFERLGRIHFDQAVAEKVPDGLFQQPDKGASCVPGMKGCVLYKRYIAGKKEEKKKMKRNPKAKTARKPD